MSGGSPEHYTVQAEGDAAQQPLPAPRPPRRHPRRQRSRPSATRFRANGWLNNWRYPGIYTYPHFHSTTHECLGVAAGWMEVELFGRGGTRVRVEAGDVIVLPAGVSHQMVGNSDDVMMVGGYPEGRDWDNIQEDHITEETRRAAAKRIMMLPIPARDPVTGAAMQEWIDAPSSVDADLNDFRDGLDPV